MSEDYKGLMRKTAHGSMVLLVGQAASTVILAAAQILIAGMLGDEKLGDYTIVFVPVSIALLVQDLGVSTGLTNYIARYQGLDQAHEKTIIVAGFVFNVIISLLVTFMVLLFAPLIASSFLHRADLELMLMVAAFSILGQAVYTTTNAIFIGHGRMELQSLNVVVFALLRSILSPLLIYLGYSTLGAVVGQTATILITGLMGFTLVIILLRNTVGEIKPNFILVELGNLLRYGLPVYMSSLVGGGLSRFYGTLMVLYVVNTEIGNYSAATYFASLVGLVTGSITLAIFPMFSKLKRGDPNLVLTYRSAVKYSSLFAMPIVGLLISLSDPITTLVFRDRFPLSGYYLQLYMLIYVYIGLGSVATGQLLNGQGETKINLRCSLITLAVGASLALLLTPRYGMVGLIATLIISPLPGVIYGLYWIRGNLYISPDWSSSAKIYLGMVASSIPAALLSGAHINILVKLFGGATLFMMVYIGMIKVLRVLNAADYDTFRALLGDRGILSHFGNRLIDLMH